MAEREGIGLLGNRVYIKASPFSFIRNTHTNLHASIYLFSPASLMAWRLRHGQRGAFLRSQAPTAPLENDHDRKRKDCLRFLRQTSPASNGGRERAWALSAHHPTTNPQSAVLSVPTTPPGFHPMVDAGKSAAFRIRAERGQPHHLLLPSSKGKERLHETRSSP